MHQVFPDYYPKFQCTAGACKHSCCIGWEIDIDEDSAARYAAMDGALGARLQQQIAWDADPPHFKLGDGEHFGERRSRTVRHLPFASTIP